MAGLSKSQKKKWYYSMFFNHKHTGTPLFIDRTKLIRVLQQATSINSQPTETTFPELPQVIIWMRCIIAIIYGTTLGIRYHTMRGSIMILNAINLITFIPYMYCRFYLNATMESYVNPQLLFVGLLPAIALTLLIWIYYFTLHHEMEMELLSKLILDSMNDANVTFLNHKNNNNDDATLRHVMDVNEVPPLTVDDSEF